MTWKKLTENHRYFLLAFALIFVFLLVYYPHYSYKFPLHADEWNHIEQAERILNNEYGKVYKNFGGNFEFGYHYILAGIFFIEKSIGINEIFAYRFLPAIFAVFASLALFLLLLKLTGNFYTGIFGMVFFASLPSNVNLLGLWFAVPMTFSIFLTYIFFYFFIGHGKKSIIYSLLILFALFFIYPPFVLLIFPVLAFYFIFNYNEIRTRKIMVFLPYLIFLVLAFKIMWYKTIWKTFFIILKTIVFKAGESHLELSSPVYLMYGIVPFVLALFGLCFLFKEKQKRILLFWFLAGFLLLLIYYIFDFSIFARNQRITYFLMLNLVLLSAIGLMRIIEFISERIKNKKYKLIVVIILLIVVFFFSFYNYGKLESNVKLYYLINNDSYKALSFLREQKNGILIAPLKEAVADYSVAGKKAVAKFYPPYEMNDDKMNVERFYSSQCEIKEKIAKNYNASYILSKEKLNCDFKEIYSMENFVYAV